MMSEQPNFLSKVFRFKLQYVLDPKYRILNIHAIALTGTPVYAVLHYCNYLHFFVSNEIIYGYNFVCENEVS